MVRTLPHRTSFDIKPASPYDAKLTLDKPSRYWNVFTPGETVEDGVLWSAVSFEGRSVGLRIESKGCVESPNLAVDVYSRASIGDRAAQQFQAAVAGKVDPDIDLDKFYRMARDDAVLQHPIDRFRGMQLTTGDSLFSRALFAISLQQVSAQRSRTMRGCIVDRFGEHVRFDGRTVSTYPSAATVADLPEARLTEDCGVGYRAEYIRGTADRIRRGFIELEDLSDLPLLDTRERLQQLPGVGEYSADVINPFRGCPIDSWSAEVFGRLLLDDDTAAVQEVKRAAEARWGVWAWPAFVYVVQDLDGLSEDLGIELRFE